MAKRFKLLKRGAEAREQLKAGMEKVYDTVRDTLGPAGRNVVIEEKAPKKPTITNDGIAIAKRIVLQDEIEDLGSEIITNAGMKTNEEVGDGTTTSMILTYRIIDDALKSMGNQELDISAKSNVNEVKNKINEAKDLVIEELNKMKKPIKTLEEIEKVAIIAVENEEIGKIIGGMIHEIGVDGFITVEAGFKPVVIHEVINGMKLPTGYLDACLSTNERKEAIREDIPILVTNKNIEHAGEIAPIMKYLMGHGIGSLAIFAPKFEAGVQPTIFWNIANGKFYTLAVKTAALTDEQLEDLCVYTGATFFKKQEVKKEVDLLGHNIGMEHLGKAGKIRVNNDETVIIDGKGKKEDVDKRIKQLKGHLDKEDTTPFQNKMKQRIASMSSGVGVIKVGAKSDIERQYLKLKVEDGVYASKAAMEKGVVPGGGLALKGIAEKLPKNILTEALKAPFLQIQENAGGKLKIGKDIVDPIKVVQVALENACSVASTFITSESVIANECRDLGDSLRDEIEKMARG